MDIKLDFLQELGNIGASHATTALSQLLQDAELKLTVPKARMLSFSEAASFIGSREEIVVCIYMRMIESIKGDMAFILPLDCAVSLANHLTGKQGEHLSEIGESALLEVGNIMLSSYVTALSLLSDTKIKPTVPGIVIDMNGAIWESILASAGIVENVTILDTTFNTEALELSGHLIFIPDNEVFESLYKRVSSGWNLEDIK
ncbi:MAG: chemotaxis protein CheC [Candidatus Wallacebacter cryptica]